MVVNFQCSVRLDIKDGECPVSSRGSAKIKELRFPPVKTLFGLNRPEKPLPVNSFLKELPRDLLLLRQLVVPSLLLKQELLQHVSL